MLKALSPAAVLLAMLALAGPAAAQDPATNTTPAPVCTGTGEGDPGTCSSGGGADQQIGDGQVVTDPAAEVDGPTMPDDGDRPADKPKRGEQHVLGEVATASSPAPVAQPATSSPAPAATAVKTLPFTGVDARPLALMGVALLLTGWLLRRRLAVSTRP
jgi:hypothetical protein